jgi:alpha-galactosidase
MRTVESLLAATFIGGASALNNGAGLTPPMGWNPWNCYANSPGTNEAIVVAAARDMARYLAPSGYEYISLDCGYTTERRDSTGNLVVNATRYPHGMKWLGDQIHALGLKFGMYGATGYAQCCSGSENPLAEDGSGPGCNKLKANQTCRNETYYVQDATLWASWGIDLLKFDGCGGPFSSVQPMRDALNATGRTILYSVHQKVDEGLMTEDLANMWRVGADIGASYEQFLSRAMISNTVNKYLPAAKGAWNDPDMLQVGNIGGAKHVGPPSIDADAEGRTQFALWCITKAPLLIGTFLTKMTAPTLATLTNKAAIAVNQDALAVQGVLRRDGGWVPNKPRPTTNPSYGFQVWSGALSSGGVAAVLANLNGTAQALTLTSADLPASRSADAAAAKWDITEAFTGKALSAVALPQTVTVGPHDVAMWILTPAAE